MKHSKTETAEAKARLLELINPGDTVYSIIRHVSASGMTRHIDLFVIRDGTPRYLSYNAATVLGWPMAPGNRGGIKAVGCGMDMAFHTVYTLAQHLFGDGYKLESQIL